MARESKLTAKGHKTVSLNNAYTAYKYCGGTYCGNGDFESLDECLEFADDGFCDYVRIVSAKGQTIKMHFTPTEENMYKC